jgi:hypothetical protein
MNKGITPYPINKTSLEFRLIKDIVHEYPEMAEIIKRHFGEDCLKRTDFKIKTLGIACILFGVDQNRLIQEIEEIQN